MSPTLTPSPSSSCYMWNSHPLGQPSWTCGEAQGQQPGRLRPSPARKGIFSPLLWPLEESETGPRGRKKDGQSNLLISTGAQASSRGLQLELIREHAFDWSFLYVHPQRTKSGRRRRFKNTTCHFPVTGGESTQHVQWAVYWMGMSYLMASHVSAFPKDS